MPRFSVHIDTENAAFEPEPGPELARLLREVAQRIETAERCEGRLQDSNGNRCGYFALTER